MSSEAPWISSRSASSAAAFCERRARLVALRVVLRGAHVALGVDRVVVLPVGDRRSRDTRLEDAGRVRERVERQVAAVGPAGDPDPARGRRSGSDFRYVDAHELVLELDPAHVEVDRELEGGAARGHPAVVELEDQEAAAREQAVERRDVAPAVRHGLRVRSAVHAHDHRVAACRVEVGGLEQRAVERRPVRGLELDPLEAAALVAQDLRARRSPRARSAGWRPGCVTQARGGVLHVGPGVGVEAAVGGHHGSGGCRPRA